MGDEANPLGSELLGELAWVRRLATRLADGDTADDLAQEVSLAALRRPPRLDLPLRPWLAAVARKLAHTRARGEARRRDRERAVEAVEADGAGAERGGEAAADARLEKAQLLCLVAELVGQLDEPHRSTVLLRYYEGLSSREIAARQGVADGTVRWRLKEAVAQLRTRLDERVQGGRRAWSVVLAQGAGPMMASLKLAAGVVAAVALGGVVVAGVARRAPSRAARTAGPAAVAATAGAPAAGASTRAPGAGAPAAAPPGSGGPAAPPGAGASAPAAAATDDPPATGDVLDQAQEAYLQGRYADAIRLGRQATGGDDAAKAWRIVGAASCFLHDAAGATEAWQHLSVPAQKFIEYVCKRNDVVVPDPAAKGAPIL